MNANQDRTQGFTNQIIDVTTLPKFEEVTLTPLNPDYWKVIMIVLAITGLIGTGILTTMLFYIEEWDGYEISIIAFAAAFFIICLIASRVGYRKKAYAFRNHDVLYKSGFISTNTIVIPYNRVQHVALHESPVSRYFGLAEIRIFTAGGSGSDIEIPGIEKSQAEDIKQLLMGKIQKQL